MKRFGLLAIGLAAAVSACADVPPPQSPPPAGIATASLRETCPLGIQNAHVTFDETATGASLTFSASTDRVDELRVRAYHASMLYGTGRRGGSGHNGKHGIGGGRHGLKPMYLPPVSVSVTDTPDGARLSFTPSDPKDLEPLLATLRGRAEKMMTRCN